MFLSQRADSRRIAGYRLRPLSIACKHPAPTGSLAKSAACLHCLTSNRDGPLNDPACVTEPMIRREGNQRQSNRENEEPPTGDGQRAHWLSTTYVAPYSKPACL